MARNADGRWINTPATPGHPYDDGIYRAAPGVTEPAPLTITLADLPAYCGPIRGHGDTVTRDCRRNNLAHQLHGLLDDIVRDRTRITRMRSAYGRANLIGYVEFAQRRLAYYLATWSIPACAHGDQAFTEPTHDTERALPACTC